jgi:hypothetical protein
MIIDSFSYGATSIIHNYFENDAIKTRQEGSGFFFIVWKELMQIFLE